MITVNEAVSASVAAEAQRHDETYLVHPDRDPEMGRFSQFPGDARAALAPILAHQHLRAELAHPTSREQRRPGYKWILFGDDDTLWFMEGVLQLLQTFDHNLPYVITDEIFWHTWGEAAAERFHEDGPPCCLPCQFNSSGAHCYPCSTCTKKAKRITLCRAYANGGYPHG